MIKQFFKCDRKGRHFLPNHKDLHLFFSFLRCIFLYFMQNFTFFGKKEYPNSNKSCTFAKLFKQLIKLGQWNNSNSTYN